MKLAVLTFALAAAGSALAADVEFEVTDAASGRAADGIKVETKLTPAGGVSVYNAKISLKGEVDRSLVYRARLRLPAGKITWHHDMRVSRDLKADETAMNVSTWTVGSGRMSYWPFGVAEADGKAYAIAMSPEKPAFYHVGCDARARELYLEADVAVTREAPIAEFGFAVFPVDTANAFRSALMKYYALHPSAFESRVKKHGLWMPFSPISKVEGWEDFGFAFKEGEDETGWDDGHGILTFHYTEPTTWWQKMKGATNAYTLADAARIAPADPQMGKAFAASVFKNAEGNPVGFVKDTPWCKGVVWNLNDAPGLKGEATGWKVKHSEHDYAKRYAKPFPEGVDGEYVDSAEMYVTVPMDFAREHFSAMKTPLSWDAKTKKPGIFKGMIAFEYVRAIAERVHDRGRLIMANGPPSRWFFLPPYLDVMGTETDWHQLRGNSRVWTPVTDAQLIYRRALCGGKPFCFLMNTDFSLFTPAMVEKYMQRSLAYAAFPGFFSVDAATGPYFTRPECYNRDRELFKKYVPLVKKISEAGWRPVNALVRPSGAVFSEQFGERYATVFNPTGSAAKTVLRFPGRSSGTLRELVTGETWSWTGGNLDLTLPAETVRLLEFNGIQ